MSIESLKEQARRHEQKEEWIKALDQYKKAIDKLAEDDQPDIGLYNRVGDLYVRVGNLPEAVVHYEQAVELYLETFLPNNAIAVCKKIIRNVPDRHKAYLRIGQIRAEQGFLPDARTNFLTYAERMQQAGDLDESFRALVEFCDLAPDEVDVRIVVADQMASHDRPSDAVEQLTVAHQHLVARGEMDQASAVEAKIRDIDPDASLEVAAAPADHMSSYGQVDLDSEPAAEPAFEIAASDDDDDVEIPEFAIGGSDEDDEEAAELPMFEIGGDEDDTTPAADEAPETPEFDIAGDDAGEVEVAVELPTFDVGGDDDLEAVDLPGFDDVADDEEAVALPMFGGDDDEGTDLPTFEETDAEEAAVDLPTFDMGDESDASTDLPSFDDALDEVVADLPMMDLGSDDDDDDELIIGGDLPLYDPTADEEDNVDSSFDARTDAVEEASEAPAEEAPAAQPPAAAPVSDEALTLGDVRARILGSPDDVALRQRMVELAYSDGEDAVIAEAFLGLAGALDRSGESSRAKAAYQQVLQADPGNAEAQAALNAEPTAQPVKEVAANEDYIDLGSLILGDEEEKTTRFVVDYEEPSGDEAADFAKMLSQFKEKVSENLDADDVKAHHDLGTAYMEMGLLDEAISEFQSALRASPDHLATYELMGQTFMEMGKPEAAVKSLERALDVPFEIEDELVGIYYYLARAYEHVGNTESAVDFYDRVFSLDINFADVTERLRVLRQN